MTASVTVTFFDGDCDEAEAAQIIRDAIADYRRARIPIDKYVRKRYQAHDSTFAQNKIKQVGRRLSFLDNMDMYTEGLNND